MQKKNAGAGKRAAQHRNTSKKKRKQKRCWWAAPVISLSLVILAVVGLFVSQQIGVYHGGLFERQDDMATVAYWYQAKPHTGFPPLPDAKMRHPR